MFLFFSVILCTQYRDTSDCKDGDYVAVALPKAHETVVYLACVSKGTI